MRQEKLSKLVDISIGRTPSRSKNAYWGEGHRWVSIRDLSSKIVTETKEQITDLALEEVKCKIVPKGALLFSFKLTIGKMAFAGRDLFTNEAIAAFLIKDEKQLNYDYLYYALLSATFSGSNQAAMGKTLNSKSLAEIKIPLPSLDDQIRIAFLLGKMEALIAKRKQHLQQLDDLLKSVFLEMFGDPVSNQREWIKESFESLGSINRGVSKHRPRNAPELLGGKYPLIQTGEVSNAGTYITSYSKTYSEIGFAQSKLWPAGTLCITIAANIAKTSILTFDACFPDSVVGFIAYKDKANALYVIGLFWFFQRILEKNAPAAAQKNINLEILRGLELPTPPIKLQEQFAAIVERVEIFKSCYQRSLCDLEDLYATLSQRAFNGELDLSRIKPPTQRITVSAIEDPSVISTATTVKKLPTINLSNPNCAAEELYAKDGLRKLIIKWVETYRTQLANEAFSIERFIKAVQNRLIELYPDNEFEIGANEYEYIKEWVFSELEANRLQQSRNVNSNMIELRAVPS